MSRLARATEDDRAAEAGGRRRSSSPCCDASYATVAALAMVAAWRSFTAGDRLAEAHRRHSAVLTSGLIGLGALVFTVVGLEVRSLASGDDAGTSLFRLEDDRLEGNEVLAVNRPEARR